MLRSMGSDASSCKPQPRLAQSTQRAGEPLHRGKPTAQKARADSVEGGRTAISSRRPRTSVSLASVGLDAVCPCRHPDCPACSTPQGVRSGSLKARGVAGSPSTMTNPFHEHRIRDAGRKLGEQPAQISYCDAWVSAQTHSGPRPMRPVSVSSRARPCGPSRSRARRPSRWPQDPPACAARPQQSLARSQPRPSHPRPGDQNSSQADPASFASSRRLLRRDSF